MKRLQKSNKSVKDMLLYTILNYSQQASSRFIVKDEYAMLTNVINDITVYLKYYGYKSTYNTVVAKNLALLEKHKKNINDCINYFDRTDFFYFTPLDNNNTIIYKLVKYDGGPDHIIPSFEKNIPILPFMIKEDMNKETRTKSKGISKSSITNAWLNAEPVNEEPKFVNLTFKDNNTNKELTAKVDVNKIMVGCSRDNNLNCTIQIEEDADSIYIGGGKKSYRKSHRKRKHTKSKKTHKKKSSYKPKRKLGKRL